MMQEARGSWNGYFKSPAGNKEQFTLRQEDGQADKDFILRVQGFNKLLLAQGWKAWAPSQDEAQPKQNGSSSGPSDPSEKFIEVISIQLAAGGDHPRWVVKGGKFKKFGITCWPETLEAAGISEKMDPLKENKPQGEWIAFYSERKDEEGKMVPDKVIRLARKQ